MRSCVMTSGGVKSAAKIKIINTEAILCFFSLHNHTFLRVNSTNYIINLSLSTLEDQLNPTIFFRISRKYIININTIKQIVSYPNSRLKVELNHLNESLIVSRERVKDFKNFILLLKG